MTTELAQTLATVGWILAGMTVLAAFEAWIPLHARGRWGRAHLAPNLALTFLTFGTNLFLNLALLALVVGLEANDLGLLRWLEVPPLPAALLAVAALDLSFYAAHVSWHRIPGLWRFHAVHHSDPEFDVTTTIRQHPVESLLRYATLAAAVMGDAILVEASLSFLGLGIAPPGAAWGAMVNDGYRFLLTNPLLSLAPGVCIMLVVM